MSVALFGGVILLAAAVYGVADSLLAPTLVPGRTDFVDAVLGSRTVVASIRVAIIFAAAFVVVSVVALISRRQWLIRVGPVEVSEQVTDLRLGNQRLEESLEEAEETIRILRYKLVESNSLLGKK